MRVQFVPSSDPSVVAARMLQVRSYDGCFSCEEMAGALGVGVAEAITEVAELQRKDFVQLVEGADEGFSNETFRWVLTEFDALMPDHEYDVLGIENEYYRILNESSEPVLYHSTLFRVIDPVIPEFWVSEVGGDGELYSCPPEWSVPGFFENYFDDESEARTRFWEVIQGCFPRTAERFN